MTTFTRRSDAVTEHLADLGLGAFVPTAYDDLAAADRSVDDTVDRVRAGLSPAVNVDELAADLVAGRLKPETAGKRLQAPAGARVQSLLDAVRAAAVAAADRPEWSPAALRRGVAPVVGQRLRQTADDMLATVAALPAVVRDRLTAVTEGQYGTHYGPLQSDALAGALKWLTPNGDLSSVRPADLAAASAADAFGPLYWLGTGVDASRNWSNEYIGAAGDAAATFAPALLLVDGDDVDLVAAGIPLTYAVAAGLVTEFAPIGDPFGGDHDVYTERVERARQFTEWRDAYRNLNMSEAGHLLGAPSSRDRARLRARLDKPAHLQVEQFRAQYAGADA
jgi:hypothetical protein